jgi:hypothetical protein
MSVEKASLKFELMDDLKFLFGHGFLQLHLDMSVLQGWSSGETSGNSASKNWLPDWISMPEIPRMLNES